MTRHTVRGTRICIRETRLDWKSAVRSWGSSKHELGHVTELGR